jgi:hypothetical protein
MLRRWKVFPRGSPCPIGKLTEGQAPGAGSSVSHDAPPSPRVRRGKPRPAFPQPWRVGALTRSAPCLLRPCCSCYLILQRKGADCGIASPVIAALCGQNANRQSEHERGRDDYAFGHHGSPLSF